MDNVTEFKKPQASASSTSADLTLVDRAWALSSSTSFDQFEDQARRLVNELLVTMREQDDHAVFADCIVACRHQGLRVAVLEEVGFRIAAHLKDGTMDAERAAGTSEPA